MKFNPDLLNHLFPQKITKPHILTGNEAFVRGLFEAGVQYLANYPGTPTSEIGDIWKSHASTEEKVQYDLSLNETIAFEAAVGASWSGVRASVVFKHLGMNLISDALHSVMYSGIDGQRRAGLVILCGGDPEISSSTNAQDVRLFSLHSKLPILEPSTVQECKDFVPLAFKLSEIINLPVMIYTPSTLNHSSSIVHFQAPSHPYVPVTDRFFRKDFDKFLNAIHWARRNQKKLNSLISQQEQGEIQIPQQDLSMVHGESDQTITQCVINENSFGEESSNDSTPKIITPNNAPDSTEELLIVKELVLVGIITSGIAWTYTNEICAILQKNIPRLRLLQTYPINKNAILDFVDNYDFDYLIILEEQESFLEIQIKDILYDHNILIPLLGKNIFPREGALSPHIILETLARPLFLGDNLVYFEEFYQNLAQIPVEIQELQQDLPIREPTFCPGCSHRNTFYSMRKAADKLYKDTGKEPIYGGDIGCYTLGMSEPYGVMDWLICMGAGVGITNGVASVVNPKAQHVVALIGDSTLFHSGLQAIFNLAKNNTPATVVILDNYYTSMTGHQLSPSTPQNLIEREVGINFQPFNILQFLKTLGNFPIKIFNGYSIKKMTREFFQIFSLEGLKFVIVDAECALNRKRRQQKAGQNSGPKTILQIIDHCTKCNECFSVLGCTAIQMQDDKYYIDTSRCIGQDCLSCLEVCPNHAIYKTEINPHLPVVPSTVKKEESKK